MSIIRADPNADGFIYFDFEYVNPMIHGMSVFNAKTSVMTKFICYKEL